MRTIYIFSIVLLTLFCADCTWAQSAWVSTYGADGNESIRALKQTDDGGFISIGITNSFGAGSYDWFLYSQWPDGDLQWQFTLGGGSDDIAHAVQTEKLSGGFIVAGETSSFGAGGADGMVVKLGPDGTVKWQKTYGLDFDDRLYSIQAIDAGYIAAGSATAAGPDGTTRDALVMQLDTAGNPVWAKTYGGPATDEFRSIKATSDGGYVAVGGTASFGAGQDDCWIMKVDAEGTPEWQQTFGDADQEFAFSAVQETIGGGYVVAGRIRSFGTGLDDMLIMKLDAAGNALWQMAYGLEGNDKAVSVIEDPDGDYVVAGTTESVRGNTDIVILKVNKDNGLFRWQKLFGAPDTELAAVIEPTSDGGYIIGGGTMSFGAGSLDALQVVLDETADIPECPLIRDVHLKPMRLADLHQPSFADPVEVQLMVSHAAASVHRTHSHSRFHCEKQTLIELENFDVIASDRAVTLTWGTASEIDTVGFNIYRATSARGEYELVNSRLIPSMGSFTTGEQYSFVDGDVHNRVRYFYLLEDVDAGGSGTMHGPVDVIPRLMYRFLHR